MIQTNTRSIFLFLIAAAICGSAESAPAAADLELSCQPLYAEQDSRTVRPTYVKGFPAAYTYYLFDSRDLMHYRVELVNISPAAIELGELGWPDRLELTVHRDGEPLPVVAVRRDLLRRTQLDNVYFLRGRRLEQKLDFRPRSGGWGLEPLQKYDDWRQERRTVDLQPGRLDPLQQIGVEIALVASDGAPLPPGIYRVNFRDPKTGKSCDREQLVVMRRPETPLDRVDGHLARFRFFKEAGDKTAAAAELRRAVDENPSSLTAWYYLSSFAYHETGDLEMALEGTEKVRALLQEDGNSMEDTPSILTLSRDAVKNLGEIRQKAASARAAAAGKATREDPDEP